VLPNRDRKGVGDLLAGLAQPFVKV